MAGTFRMGEQPRRSIRSRLVLQRIKRHQRALRRNCYRLSRVEVGRELVAIGRELFQAAPLFFPEAFESDGKTVSANSRGGPLRNGHHPGLPRIAAAGHFQSVRAPWNDCRRSKRPPRVESLGDKAWEELLNAGKTALGELEQMVRDLEGEDLRAEASW